MCVCVFPLGAGHGFTGRSSRPGFHVEARTLVEMPTAILDRQTADRTGTELCAAGLKRQTMEMTTQKSGVAFFTLTLSVVPLLDCFQLSRGLRIGRCIVISATYSPGLKNNAKVSRRNRRLHHLQRSHILCIPSKR